jgi:hypothetical protein
MKTFLLPFAMILSACVSGYVTASADHVISLTVDGRSEMVFDWAPGRFGDGTVMRVNHISWGKPANLVIDGAAVELIWDGNKSQPIQFPLTGEYWVRKSKGRDGGYAIQTLDAFTLACVDNPDGADSYVFELYSEPSQMSTEWMRVNVNGGLPTGRFDLSGMPGFVDGFSDGSQIEFSAMIDGSEEFVFADGNLVIQHLSWSEPVDFRIDRLPIPLFWMNNYSQQIPVVLPSRFQIIQTSGAGTIYPVETPVGLLLSVADESKGTDLYSWKIVAVREPAASADHVISLTVDGRSEMVFDWAPGRFGDGTVMRVNHISWGKPANLVIDGAAVELIWDGNKSQPIQFPLTGEYWVRKSKGRDGGYAIQTLDAFTLACVDNPDGADSYVFELYSEPSQMSTEWMRVNVNGGLPTGRFDLSGMPGFVDGFSDGSQIEFSAMIDGSEEFVFADGNLVIQHLSWSEPVDFRIDRLPIPLFWMNNYSQQIPVVLPSRFQIIQTSGAGTIYPVETPVGLLLSVADESKGTDLYSWKIVAGL